jgi:hypothetical protein
MYSFIKKPAAAAASPIAAIKSDMTSTSTKPNMVVNGMS